MKSHPHWTLNREAKEISTLIIGGARSGKSRYAQEMAAASGGQVLFVATAEPADEEMERRIREHRRNRPPAWRTLEAPRHVGQAILKHAGDASVIIVDCVTLLVNNVFSLYTTEEGELIKIPDVEKEIEAETADLVECLRTVEADFIIVTNEVGMDLVPVNYMGRVYRDLLGAVNQELAAAVDEVILMVAGQPLLIKPGRAG